jgi:hypothetical protein
MAGALGFVGEVPGMQTNIWYDLELMELVGGSTAEDLIREAEAAQPTVDESENEDADDKKPGA